ncbi:MAG TPA: hypothetical protein VFV03_04305 [Solirubrobacteraceae bacterium]|nr:hypothetical protein [Solirubrobacteraceae bacterium]
MSAAAGPKLKLYVLSPDTVKAGERVAVTIGVVNTGTQTTSGAMTFSDTAGAGFTSVSLSPFGMDSSEAEGVDYPGEPICETSGLTFKCTIPWLLTPGGQLHIPLQLTTGAGASGTLSNSVTISGGGTLGDVSEEQHVAVEPRGPFAFTHTAAELLNGDGSQDTQAASDPTEFTTSLKLRSFSFPRPGRGEPSFAADEHFKDVTVNLPVGFVGNPTTAPVCTAVQLVQRQLSGGPPPLCPVDSQVGIVYLSVGLGQETVFVGLYNMVPPPGMATELGFNFEGTIVLIDAFVRPGDHGIGVVSRNTSSTIPIRAVDVTVWGVPADSSHDAVRGVCMNGYRGAGGRLCPAVTKSRKAFLRMPTSCPGTPLAFEASSNSYEHPSVFIKSSFASPALDNCGLVPFAPGISVEPTGTAANTPTGVSVQLSLQQNSNPEGLAEADLKKAVVTLPEGMVLNPSSADGLQACTDEQLHFDSNTPAECPDGSKVGTVLLHTPLLSEPIEGSIFVRTQNSFDPASGEMFRIVLELRNDARGIDIKVPGQVAADPVTGRLTSTFDNAPQLPFSDISLHFQAGARAPLTTPASCLPQTTEADLYSWAQPSVAVHRAMTFNLTSGPEGTACPPPVPFNPRFDAGVSSVQAGGFTPFLVTFSRKDSDQSMQRVSVKMPQGLLGSLIGLPLCGEAQANAGTCSQASEIGSLTAGAGSGPTPFYVTGGKVFMTGPYEGAPFGLSVVVPAKAGPFNLGTVVVRSKVEVDPHTAQLTVTTDPLPQIVGGVPVNLRLVNVTINRPDFTYNPTSCDPSSVVGTMTGGQGAVASLSNHFQVTNCGALKFQPHFTVSTSGKTSRANGASLTAKLNYPVSQGTGTEANIARVKVSLPKQLPSRLTTLQKACTAETFAANPAACPAPSRIGTATATTPVLPVSLSGPVYFVSHGGAAFPDLVIVLQGYGVTVDLVGTTFISKAGITSTTFKTIPDVPVGTFELKLPQGKFSALAANGNLCNSKLSMPTAFIAQDGAEVHQSTPIGVSGCAKHKTKARKASGRVKHAHGAKGDRGKKK